jgi:ubiquinone/menaquinone biosynthesis C-methylase UbiE
MDVGSGSGGWVFTTARTYPEMNLIGIDISQRMVDYARRQAKDLQLDGRVEFHVMDALLLLEFPNDYFDLVNLRFGVGYLRTWDWPKMISEMLRVCRPGGVIRVTECEVGGQSSSSAIMQIYDMLTCALFRSGHLFEEKKSGLIDHLVPLLTRHGCQQVQSRICVAAPQVGTPEATAASENIVAMCRVSRPFLEKWGCLASDYDTISQQVLEQLQDPESPGSTTLLTVWGNKPGAALHHEAVSSTIAR